jgi:hypothetical protein
MMMMIKMESSLTPTFPKKERLFAASFGAFFDVITNIMRVINNSCPQILLSQCSSPHSI